MDPKRRPELWANYNTMYAHCISKGQLDSVERGLGDYFVCIRSLLLPCVSVAHLAVDWLL